MSHKKGILRDSDTSVFQWIYPASVIFVVTDFPKILI